MRELVHLFQLWTRVHMFTRVLVSSRLLLHLRSVYPLIVFETDSTNVQPDFPTSRSGWARNKWVIAREMNRFKVELSVLDL